LGKAYTYLRVWLSFFICVVLLSTGGLCKHQVRCTTTKGSFVLQVYREWDAASADRFLMLTDMQYFENMPFYRVVEGVLAQFGIPEGPQKGWQEKEAFPSPEGEDASGEVPPPRWLFCSGGATP